MLFSEASTIFGCLYLSSNYVLADMSGLGALTTIHGDVEVSLNRVMDLSAFDRLETVAGNLELRSIDVMPSITGLARLTRVDGELVFQTARRRPSSTWRTRSLRSGASR